MIAKTCGHTIQGAAYGWPMQKETGEKYFDELCRDCYIKRAKHYLDDFATQMELPLQGGINRAHVL